MENVSKHLTRIAELSRAAADAVAGRNETLVCELDKQVENELGGKIASLALFASIAKNTAADQRVNHVRRPRRLNPISQRYHKRIDERMGLSELRPLAPKVAGK